MSNAGRPKISEQFELYVWLLVELMRDRQAPLSQLSEMDGCRSVKKLLGVDWPVQTIKQHAWKAKQRMVDGGPEQSLLAGLRQWRDESGDVEPLDLLVAVDKEWRRYALGAVQN